MDKNPKVNSHQTKPCEASELDLSEEELEECAEGLYELVSILQKADILNQN